MNHTLLERILSFFLAIVLVFSMVPTTGFAAETEESSSVVESDGSGTTESETPETPSEGDGDTAPVQAVDVSTMDALEQALADQAAAIRITADMEMDRTLFITHDVTIFTEEARTLTRAAGFGGDLFVVGEAADGTACEVAPTLKLGDPNSSVSGLLTIDGNKDNMTVDVVGSVLFVTATGQANLYENLTVTNCAKVGNERALNVTSGLSSNPKNVGGAVGVVVQDGTLNIYGGIYSGNSVAKSDTSNGYGGAFFSHSTMNIYGGTFENNTADARAGAIYGYRALNIYRATFTGNSSALGGAIYMPSSTAAALNICGTAENDTVSVIFSGNSSTGSGGAISYSGPVTVENALFDSNTATKAGGAMYGNGSYSLLSAQNVSFLNNTAGTNGGALFINTQSTLSSAQVDLLAESCTFTGNYAESSGGAVYLNTNTRAYLVRSSLTGNSTSAASDANGGAIYALGASLEVNHSTISENNAYRGGAIAGVSTTVTNDDSTTTTIPAVVVLNDVTANGNYAVNSSKGMGGFLYNSGSVATVYDSAISSNQAYAGSAIYFTASASGSIYNTDFTDNACYETNTGNAGAIYIYPGAATGILIHSCDFTGNTSAGLGGAILANGKALVELYNVTATGNSAMKGGFMYETSAGTSVTVSGLTVSGNTATTGGPIIWGNTANAKLYINKANYTDLDATGDLDDTYWAAAIYNKLTVSEVDTAVPSYPYYDQPEFDTVYASEVRTGQQLAGALAYGHTSIKILNDLVIDRTCYITKDTVIYSDEPVTLTRAADFAGDIFVVGEAADGTACEEKVTLTLGNPESDATDLLTIDGNSENMTVDVTGSVIFICNDHHADLHNLTVTNCTKVGNEKTLTEAYGVSYVSNVGGAVGIITLGASMNIYGGSYTNNHGGSTAASGYGGAFYNFGTMKVYGGLFEGNSAYRAGVFYNYRKLYLYNAEIVNNHAYSAGGAIYQPASTGSFLYVGLDNDLVESKVTFDRNTSDGNGGAISCSATAKLQNVTFSGNSAVKGGAIYASGKSNVTAVSAVFTENTASESGGAMYAASAMVSADGCQFTDNSAVNGGAVYVTGQSSEATDDEEVEFIAHGASFSGNSATNGGAIHMADTARVKLTDATFHANTAATSGGAIYNTGAILDIDTGSFTENTAASGGGIYLLETATAVMNSITATGNSVTGTGGFLYATAATVNVYNSTIQTNSAKNGGGMYLFTGAQGGIYNTVFDGNTATANAGALFLYTDSGNVLIHTCTFNNNTGVSGGAIYASKKSIVEMYNITATNNSADKGGFLYETTTGTTITISGLTVSGNTATTGGPIIWGNSAGAVLNLNKASYTDLDATGELDDAYWANAIANSLTVNDSDATVPYYPDYGNEDPGELRDAFDVGSADELEAALAAGESRIRITADFMLDRTFYITSDTIIFSSSRRTLTRAADFGGDIFVVGEAADGTLCSQTVTLTLGNPGSATKNLLKINGNDSNMTTTVSGTVIFVCGGANAELHENLTVTDCRKTANEKTNTGAYGVSYPDTVGGAVAILAKSATMTIYGGTYSGNSVNGSGSVSSYGGAFYNFGVLSVYGGTFANNSALRGGVFYNYRTMRIYKATITGNSATLGGMVYVPASTSAFLYLGGENDVVESAVTITGNSATNGGAIYNGATTNIQDTVFQKNSAKENGGAVYTPGSTNLTVNDSTFTENSAEDNGGAIYMKTAMAQLESTTFQGNTAVNGGAICANGQSPEASDYELSATDVTFDRNSATEYGGAVYLTKEARAYFAPSTFTGNSAAENGGAIALLSGSSAVLRGSVADGNTAEKEGGFVYSNASKLSVYDSTVSGNKASSGGAIALRGGAEGYICTTTLENNTATENGGALLVGSDSSNAFLHSCTLAGNSAAENGGAAYVCDTGSIEIYNATATGNTANFGGVVALAGESTEANVNGLTVSGNTATEGSVIYGASDSAVLTVSKTNWTDADNTGAADDAYWAGVIGGSLSVTETDKKVPGYAEYGNEDSGELWQAITVTTADELEAALLASHSEIRIGADFVIDRTFTVTADTTIFTTKAHTLTRSADFAGDLFAVSADATLTLGNPISDTEDLLVISGEGISTAATVIRLADGAQAELYPNLTVKNCVTTADGAVAVVPATGSLTIHGGHYTGNIAENGGVLASVGTVTVTGGEFSENQATNGGVMYITGGSVTLEGGNFLSCTATKGGVLTLSGNAQVVASGITAQNNSAATGGFAAVDGGAGLTVTDSELSKNTASENGGAIHVSGGSLQLDGTTLSDNKAKANGGAIALESGASAQLNNVLGGNNAAAIGGFLYVEASNLGISGSTVSGNKAPDGGAIALVGAVSANIQTTEFMGNTASNNGGALWTDSQAILDQVSFTGNKATNGGAIYMMGAGAELMNCTFTENTANNYGGAIALYKGASLLATDLTATGNTAAGYGGFLYSSASTVTIHGAQLENNSASRSGGAMAITQRSTANIYGASFTANVAAIDGGAVYSSNSDSLVSGCSFSENSAGSYGGAAYLTGSSTMALQDVQTAKNAADMGGVAYLSGSSAVTVSGMTASGNTATSAGPIFYGTYGAVLNVDPEGTTYSAAGSLTVNKITGTTVQPDTGKEIVDPSWKVTNVSSASQLQSALAAKAPYIRITADFTLDRTFYITYPVTIFSTEKHTLTRAKNFAGDLFVVGEYADGSSGLLGGHNSKLTLGNPLSDTEDLLIIDGNRSNLTTSVNGTAVFISEGGIVDLYDNVTLRNHLKLDNARVLDEGYGISHRVRIGGAAIMNISGTLTIHGGKYYANAVNVEDPAVNEDYSSTYGGAIYNSAALYIYGGTFYENEAPRGGAIYNYRVVRIMGGTFRDNYASKSGGAYYAPSSGGIHTIVGSEDKDGCAPILFEGNRAYSNGGAFYNGVLSGLNFYGNTTISGNVAEHSNGGAIYTTGQLRIRNVVFENNTAANRGGAIATANGTEDYVTRYVELSNCVFSGNTAKYGGGIGALASSANTKEGSIVFLEGCEFAGNNATSAGGAIHTDVRSKLTAEDCRFHDNTSSGEAGAVYSIGLSKANFTDCVFANNASTNHGGALSVRSAYMTLDGVTVSGNLSSANGGALYISYSSSYAINSVVTITDSIFTGNTGKNGGVIYATKRSIEKEHHILTVTDTTFENNKASTSGGAVRLTGGVQVYMRGVKFLNNAVTASGSEGGAISAGSCVLEMDDATFTGNTAKESGGAIFMSSGAKVVLNKVTATGNSSGSGGGFLYSTEATLDIYNSNIKENDAGNGGGMYLYYGAVSNIRSTKFTGNTAKTGAGMFIYTDGANVMTHSCTFTDNASTGFGGGLYISGVSKAQLYNTKATENSAGKGGFLYETKAGTEVLIAGLTVSGNEATEGGSIIWGNTFNAVLNINKALYTDADHSGTLDDAYWAEAIYNALTVKESSATVPENVTYTSRKDPAGETTSTNPYVSVKDVLNLGLKSSDADINDRYSSFPKLDNSSNFMSRGTTYFKNINGGTVSVDTFVYENSQPDGNMQVGLGLLIYQAILYKQKYPNKEVYIDASSYRFSVQAAVNINRNSRYFGYMRNLPDADYDDYGFVRIAYLLVTAAKMGIHVTVIGQLDGYPISSSAMNFEEYFTYHLNDPCDKDYATGYVRDYMNFQFCDWTLEGKGGTDMMHTKMCAVSAYLDMNGKAHYNAVWSSSTNFDGIRSSGGNGNWKQQTATIVSDHEAIYRVCHNYLQLVADNCEQEDVIEWQDLVATTNTQQIDLILAGRGDEIPKDEQIVYIGTEQDDVFEMYFTPMGGGALAWSEIYNPYCKYIRKLYDSEDYIEFSWNAAEYGSYLLARQIENLVSTAFHEKPNVNNKIYVNAEHFDASKYDDLVVGKDIGYKSFNSYDFGTLHNKDILMSYVEDGQRYFVSLLNSMNVHSGSMYYQSNFMLVIKETSCADDSVYKTVAKYSILGDFGAHTYGEEQTYLPDGKDGYTYHVCKICGHKEITGEKHHEGSWIIDKDATPSANGIRHTECTICGEMVRTEEFAYAADRRIVLDELDGLTFSSDFLLPIGTLSSAPHTFEAIIQVPTTLSGRGGVIVSNYNGGNGNQISLEVYSKGRIRLFAKSGSTKMDCIFSTDIRSDSPVHIAVSVKGTKATLYVDGVAVESKTLSMELPAATGGYCIGGDNRKSNAQYFKGVIYGVSLFSDTRSSKEIKRDCKLVVGNAGSMLYSRYYEGRADYVLGSGKTFSASKKNSIQTLTGTPKTLEAVIQLPTSVSGRGGVIVSNYGSGASGQISLEVYTKGRIRLFVNNDGTKSDCVFSTDIRSDKAVHIAVTVKGTKATLYVNGLAKETKTLKTALPYATEKFVVGGDHRSGNKQYFKGTIYSVNLYSDVRSSAEVKQDALVESTSGNSMLFGKVYGETKAYEEVTRTGKTFTAGKIHEIGDLSGNPNTIEALIHVPTGYSGRGGVIVSNYDGGTGRQICLEVYTGGRIRLTTRSGDKKNDIIFSTDIRSDKPVHIAVTVDDTKATLYVNGTAKQTKYMSYNLPKATKNFCIGGDHRTDNTQYFKGTIYSVALFNDVRTAKEVAQDMLAIAGNESKLMYHTGCTDYGMVELEGLTFSADQLLTLDTLAGNPNTIEALIHVPTGYSGRGGVIVSNYDGGTGRQISLEVYTKGRIRLFTRSGDKKNDIVFSTDIRSDSPVHVAVGINGKKVTLYVNGTPVEVKYLTHNLPKAVKNFCIGGDHRSGNKQYFKGTIYSVALFDSTRTAKSVAQDVRWLDPEAAKLMYAAYLIRPHTAGGSDSCGNHTAGNEIVDHAQTSKLNGISHTACNACGEVIFYREVRKATGTLVTDYGHLKTLSFSSNKDPKHTIGTLSAKPLTFEVMLQLDPAHDERGGVLVSNYDGGEQDQISLEIYTGGRPRLYFKSGGTGYTCQFDTDVRSKNMVHLAITVDGTTAKLYLNGELVETKTLKAKLPKTLKNYCIGGDYRSKNSQYFKGKIYEVTLFNDVRTAKEIAMDSIRIPTSTKGIIYHEIFD